jgi:hypothetical protein
MINTYRKFKNGEVVSLKDYNKEDDTYYCEATYYEDNQIYEREYLIENTTKASILDIAKYKIAQLLYKL